MFGNFLYFIIVLLIYSTYPATEAAPLPLSVSIIFFLLLGLLFAAFTAYPFKTIQNRLLSESFLQPELFSQLDQRFNRAMSRQTIMAVMLIAVDVYGLGLSSHTRQIPLLAAFPTLEALLFLAVFTGYLSVVWASAHTPYQRLYGSRTSRYSYVASNIMFALPVLLPWLLLSSFSDVVRLLPFDGIRAALQSTWGEIGYSLFFLAVAAICGPVLVRHFWRCTPLEPGIMRTRIENICKRAGVEYRDILYWPIFEGRMITAGVMGMIRQFRYILVTEALLETLSLEEIEAVIAHEIGHVKRWHLLFYLLFFVGFFQIVYGIYAGFDLIVNGVIYLGGEAILSLVSLNIVSWFTLISAFFALLVIVIFVIYFRYVFGFFMRNFERQADGYVYKLFNSAMPLISTFDKITQNSGQPPDKPNWHHFSISERVGFLLKCESNRGWLRHHDRKVAFGIGAYLVALILLAVAGYQLDNRATGEQFDTALLEQIMLTEVARNPDDPEIHRMLGEFYYETSRLQKAADAYQTALAIAPKNPEVLNNLAWLYATSDVERLRNPEKALELAKRAVSLSPEAHVLDTLAESYYINNNFKMAFVTGEAALAAVNDDREYYEQQLEKFEKALKREMEARRKDIDAI